MHQADLLGRLGGLFAIATATAIAMWVLLPVSVANAFTIESMNQQVSTIATHHLFTGGRFRVVAEDEASDASSEAEGWSAELESQVDPIISDSNLFFNRTNEGLARASVESGVSSSRIELSSRVEKGASGFAPAEAELGATAYYFTNGSARTQVDVIFEVTRATNFTLLVEGATSSSADSPSGSVLLEEVLTGMMNPVVFRGDLSSLGEEAAQSLEGVLLPGRYRFEFLHAARGEGRPAHSTLSALLTVPEPGTSVLMFLGLCVLGLRKGPVDR